MANRNNNKAANNANTAKPNVQQRAARIVQQHGLAALPRIAKAAPLAAASQRRYGVALMALTPSFANATFTLTALGKGCFGVAGCIGRNGQPTAMGLTAVALGNLGGQATGAAIVAAIIGNPQLMAAMGATKANGVHILPNTATAAKWAQGYVNGLCRPAHGLATKAL